MNIGKSILDIRKNRKMSQEEFGKLFHVTRQTVSNWENEKSYPDLQILVNMSEMFEISLDKLLKEDHHMIKVIDKERKYGKAGKVILAILSISLIVSTIYSVIWNSKKTSYENNFSVTLEKNHFNPDTKKMNGQSQLSASYSKQSGNTVYTIYPPSFPKISDFRFTIPASKQFIVATCKKNDRFVDLRVDKDTNLIMFYRIGTDVGEIDAFIDDKLIDDDGNMNLPDGEMKEIYDSMKDDIQITVREMRKLHKKFFQTHSPT